MLLLWVLMKNPPAKLGRLLYGVIVVMVVLFGLLGLWFLHMLFNEFQCFVRCSRYGFILARPVEGQAAGSHRVALLVNHMLGIRLVSF